MLMLEYNAVLLFMATVLAYPFSVYFYRHYSRNDRRKWVHVLGEMGLIVLAGPWMQFLTSFFFVIISARVFGYLWFKDEHFKGRPPDLKLGQRIRAGFFRFILVALMISLVISFAVATIGRFTGGDWIAMSSLVAAIGLLLVAWKTRIPFYNKPPTIRVKSKEFVSVAAILVIMVPLTLVSVPVNRGEIAGGVDIKVMCYNIHYPEENVGERSWTERRGPLADYIDALNLDIFGLQESFYDQCTDLLGNLTSRNYTFVGNGRAADGGGEIDSIWYDQNTFTLIENGTFWLSYTPNVSSTVFSEIYPRTVGWAHLKEKTTGEEFYFYNTHYGFYMEFNIWASHQVNQDIASRTGDLPVVFMGDYNSMSLPIVPFYSFLEGYGTKPLFQAHRLLHGYADPLKIDFILVTPDIHVSTYAVLSDANDGGQWLSDHVPNVMECTLPVKP